MEEFHIYPHRKTDLELAAIQSLAATLCSDVRSKPDVATQGCFYHLCQSTWRKIQELGRTEHYRTEDEVKHFCGMLDGFAFLPQDKVQAGMQYLKQRIPEGMEALVDYFNAK